MRKGRNKTEREGPGTISGRGIGREPVDLTAIRNEISQLVGAEAVRMVQRIIDEADIRHYAAMKYLFEMAGLYPAVTQEENADADSLAKTLLDRLGLDGDPLVGSEVTKDREMAAVASPRDAVE